jgi:serine/threonine protein kinase
VARALDAAATPKLTETGMLVGSPAYMSPEQAAGAQTLDGRSDQYSLACVLYEMLTGEPLFSGPTPQAIMAKRAAARPSSVDMEHVHAPALTVALRRALAMEPAGRFPSAEAFSNAMSMADQGHPRKRVGWLKWW